MHRKYLLDTSAVRCLPTSTLAEVSQLHDLYVSPFCFWEILGHLEEHGSFDSYKSLLMKFKHVEVLDDPFANIHRLRERIPDNDLIEASLAALRDSTSLSDFYSKYIRDSKGAVRSLSDCAARGDEILYQEEEKYIRFLKNATQLLDSGRVRYETDAHRHQAILSLVEGWLIQLRESGVEDVSSRERLVNDTYIYFSYIFHRALRCVLTQANVDRNDHEDAALCLHLKLNSPINVVAADKGLRQALNLTISLISKIGDPELCTSFDVIAASEFSAKC